jgi:hypothetical protein
MLFHYVIVQNISVASKTKKIKNKKAKKNRSKRRLLVSAVEN